MGSSSISSPISQNNQLKKSVFKPIEFYSQSALALLFIIIIKFRKKMFHSGNILRANQFAVHDDHITIRPYNKRLNEYTSNMCAELGLHGQNDVCLFESRLAVDCVVRNKQRKFGDI